MSQIKNYLFIDGSYYIFYRFHALRNWFKLSHPEEPLNIPFENEEFRTKFITSFNKKLQEIPKKLNLSNYQVIIGKDCKRENIWRMEHHNSYKGTRDEGRTIETNPGDFFKIVYENNMFIDAFGLDTKIIHHKFLEADDCIALYVNNLIENEPEAKITIITSDTDYLQLLKTSNIQIYNLNFKTVNNLKNSTGNYEKDLLKKIIMGDKSDNIPALFNKCGEKTVQKYLNDELLFNKELIKQNKQYQYELNRLLIDFNEIPENYKNEFYETFISQ